LSADNNQQEVKEEAPHFVPRNNFFLGNVKKDRKLNYFHICDFHLEPHLSEAFRFISQNEKGIEN
jgi:hypothetical protein